MKHIIIFTAIWFFVVNLFALGVLNRFTFTSGDTAYDWIDPANYQQEQSWSPVRLHAKWDSFWHLSVVGKGYFVDRDAHRSNIVFFPLYPHLVLLVSLATPFTHGDLILPGWIVSIIFLFLSAVYLYKLTARFHPQADAQLAVFLLLIFPTAFFLNAVYTESLFLFLSIACLYYARDKKFLWAGVFGLLATLTRFAGVILVVPLVIEYFQHYGRKGIWQPRWLLIGLVPAGLTLFFAYHYLAFGNFWLFFEVQNWWGRAFALNHDHLIFAQPAQVVSFVLDAVFAVTGLVAAWFVGKKIRASYGWYMLAATLVPLSTGTLMSVGRFVLVLFPLYIWVASWRRGGVAQQTWILISVLLLALHIMLFANGYWAG